METQLENYRKLKFNDAEYAKIREENRWWHEPDTSIESLNGIASIDACSIEEIHEWRIAETGEGTA